MRAALPPGYTIPSHTHPGVEHVTLLSGSAFLGTGAEPSRELATELPAGSFFLMPPGEVHALYTGSEPVVLQLHGQGPWAVDYVHEGDDPRNRDGQNATAS